MPSICFVAGDPSGDLHAARLISALRARLPTLLVTGLGGPAMRSAGAHLLDDLTTSASIGPFDAARHLGKFIRARRLLDAHLESHRPDLVILVDFGDFNLPVIAPLAKRHHLRVLYYISPQLWAWGRWRLRWVKRYVDHMLVLFQFEERFYREAGVPVTWVGHPLIDAVQSPLAKAQAVQALGLNPWRMTIGLLPGSREPEVIRHMPLLMKSARHIAWQMPGVQFLVPQAPGLSERLFQPLMAARGVDITVCSNRMYDGLRAMDGAIVTSGTATLETALFEIPMVVVYRTSLPTYLAAKAVVRTSHIAMVNLVGGTPIVPELIQYRATPHRIAETMIALMRDATAQETMRRALRALQEELGPPGAVDRAAEVIVEWLRKS